MVAAATAATPAAAVAASTDRIVDDGFGLIRALLEDPMISSRVSQACLRILPTQLEHLPFEHIVRLSLVVVHMFDDHSLGKDHGDAAEAEAAAGLDVQHTSSNSSGSSSGSSNSTNMAWANKLVHRYAFSGLAGDPAADAENLGRQIFYLLLSGLKVNRVVGQHCRVWGEALHYAGHTMKSSIAFIRYAFGQHLAAAAYSDSSRATQPSAAAAAAAVEQWLILSGRSFWGAGAALAAVCAAEASSLDDKDLACGMMPVYDNWLMWLGHVLKKLTELLQVAGSGEAAAAAAQGLLLLQQPLQLKLEAAVDLYYAQPEGKRSDEAFLQQMLKHMVSEGVPQQLQAFGAAVCAAYPVPYCCNNPGCEKQV